MGEKPTKIRMLEIFKDGQPRWNYEVVFQILKEYSMKGDYNRDVLNFNLIELASGGMLSEVDQKVDTEGIYKQNFLIRKYVITDFGKEKAESACAK
jgi:hypothetical protein